ncbi:MAG: TlpA disulfide reductase family protein [Pirellulales bacterium]
MAHSSETAASNDRSPLVSLLGVGLVIVVGIALAMLVFRESPADADPTAARQHAAVGLPLPDLSVEPLVGAKRKLALADLSGKIVLVNLWGPWCPPCRRELPELAELSYSLRDREDFIFLLVAYGDSADVEKLRRDTIAFFRDVGHELPCYHDPGGTTMGALAQLPLEQAFPTTLLVDGRGRVNAVWQGYKPGIERQMATAIDELLEPAK